MEANRTALEIIARETGRGLNACWRAIAAPSSARAGTIRPARPLHGNADHVLVYHLSGNTDVERRRHGPVTGFRSRIGALTFMPRASDTEWRVGGPTQVLHLYLPHSVFEEFSRDTLEQDACPEIDAFFAVTDPWLDGFFRMLASESPPTPPTACAPNPWCSTRSVRCWSGTSCNATARTARMPEGTAVHGGTLRQSVMRKLAEVFAERLHEDIRLQDPPVSPACRRTISCGSSTPRSARRRTATSPPCASSGRVPCCAMNPIRPCWTSPGAAASRT